MAEKLGEAVLELRTDDKQYRQGIMGAKKLAGKLGTALKAGALVGGAAIAGLGVAAIKFGADFEKSLAEVRTLLPDLNDQGFNKLRTGVLDLSKELGIATSEAVPALYQAISAGVPPDNVLDFMRTAGKVAIGGVTDLETAVDGVTSVINAYGSDAIDAGKASDIMFTAVKLGKTTMGELSKSLFNVIPIAAASGVNFEQVAAALAALTAQGVPTAEATNQLRAAIQSLSAPTVRQQKLIDELGLDFSKASLKQKGLSGAMKEAIAATGGNMAQLRKLFGSVEAVQAVLALGGEQSGKFTDALAAMEGASGASEAAFDTMAETTSFKFQKAMNLLKVSLTEVGIKILPLLTKALEKAVPFLEKNLPKAIKKIERGFKAIKPFIAGFISAVGTLIRIGVKLVGFLRDNKEILLAVGIAIGAVLVPGIIAWTMATLANAAAHITLAAAILIVYAPIILLIAGIALLALGIIQLIKHWDDVKAAVIAFKDTLVEVFNTIKEKIVSAFNTVLDFLEDNWPLILAIITGPIGLIVLAVITFKDDILRIFGEVIDFIKGLPSKILGALGDLGGLLLQKGKDLLGGLLGGIKEVWGREKRFWSDLPSKVKRLLGSLLTTLWNKGFDLVMGLLNGIKSAWNLLTGWITGKIDDLKDLFTSGFGLFSPSKVFRGYGQGMVEGLVAGLKDRDTDLNRAIGKTFAIAGAGLPTIAGRLNPMASSASQGVADLVSGGAGASLVIQNLQVNAATSDPDGLARALVPAIEREWRTRRQRGV